MSSWTTTCLEEQSLEFILKRIIFWYPKKSFVGELWIFVINLTQSFLPEVKTENFAKIVINSIFIL